MAEVFRVSRRNIFNPVRMSPRCLNSTVVRQQTVRQQQTRSPHPPGSHATHDRSRSVKSPLFPQGCQRSWLRSSSWNSSTIVYQIFFTVWLSTSTAFLKNPNICLASNCMSRHDWCCCHVVFFFSANQRRRLPDTTASPW